MGALKLATAVLALVTASPAAADPVARWRPHIIEASLRFGIPETWIERVIGAESGGMTMLDGRPIRSPKGAMGLMQLMPPTWAMMRARLGLGDDPDDPRDNILAGAGYLRMMYDRFGYPGLFGAYNAGPARYAAWLAGKGRLPSETIAYLGKVGGQAVEAQLLVRPKSPPTLFAVRHDLPVTHQTEATVAPQPVLFAIRKGTP